jgi:hypothetical protein
MIQQEKRKTYRKERRRESIERKKEKSRERERGREQKKRNFLPLLLLYNIIYIYAVYYF